jgi:hypothetical protein
VLLAGNDIKENPEALDKPILIQRDFLDPGRGKIHLPLLNYVTNLLNRKLASKKAYGSYNCLRRSIEPVPAGWHPPGKLYQGEVGI